jgi:hypothetical protein
MIDVTAPAMMVRIDRIRLQPIGKINDPKCFDVPCNPQLSALGVCSNIPLELNEEKER